MIGIVLGKEHCWEENISVHVAKGRELSYYEWQIKEYEEYSRLVRGGKIACRKNIHLF